MTPHEEALHRIAHAKETDAEILEDARIHDRASLKAYRAHWQQKRAEDTEWFGPIDESRVLSDKHVGRWIEDMPTVLGFLNDPLSPPLPDADLDGMIHRVLSRLRDDPVT